MRQHSMPKFNPLKEASAEIIDMAAIGTRIFTLPREISNRTGYELRN